jgi:mono/diheme cytochrome c family protein
MRRVALIALGFAFLLAGCGAGQTVYPIAQTVVGTLQTAPMGDPKAGLAVFKSAGCGNCHTFKPAGSTAKVGPDLDNIAADAKKANQGPLADYVHTSITDPNAYVVPGYPKGVMPPFAPPTLSDKQIADLVAFITQNQKS